MKQPSHYKHQTYRHSDSVRINYEEAGEGRGKAVVFLHGFGASHETWIDIRPKLPGGYRYYFLDMKGFGLSSKPRHKRYTMTGQAEIVAGFIGEQNLRSVVLVGHSYGGAVALATCAQLRREGRASVVKGLVIIAAPSFRQRLPLYVIALRTPILNRLGLMLTPARWSAAFILYRLFHDRAKVTRERIDRYAAYFNLPGSHRALINSARNLRPRDERKMVEIVPQVDAPALLIWGANDPIIPPRQGERLNAALARSRFELIERCGHVPQEERPTKTARLMLNFLRSINF